jgi:DNA-directed RNA polymerase subunit RPC12/RpoP
LEKLSIAREIKKTCVESDHSLRLKVIKVENFEEVQEVQIKDDLEQNSDQEFHVEHVSAIETIMDQEANDSPLKLEAEIKSESGEFFVVPGSDPSFIDKKLNFNRKHKKKEKTKTAHQCSRCGKIYSKTFKLKRHEITHTASQKFSCDLCNSKFLFKIQLVTHMKQHLNLREYRCSICGKAYNKSGILSDHIRRTHASEKKFECFCGKKFTERFRLNRHMIIHSGEKRHEVCF